MRVSISLPAAQSSSDEARAGREVEISSVRGHAPGMMVPSPNIDVIRLGQSGCSLQPSAKGNRLLDRAILHRRTADRALHSVEEAVRFVREMGIVLRAPDPHLPSLFSAAQGKPFKPGVGGFGEWPAHAWWWDRQILALPDVVAFKLICGRTTFATKKVWPAIDAAVRGRPPEKFDSFTSELMAELRKRGATASRELHVVQSYGRTGARLLKKARAILERRGLLIARPVVHDPHLHDSVLELWKTRFPKPLTKHRGVECLLLACLTSAAGPVPTRRVLSWLAWPREALKTTIADLTKANLVRQIGGDQIERVF